jgi:hypothetical protein
MGLLSWIYGGDQLQAEGDKLDAQIADTYGKDYAPGGRFYNAGQWNQIQQDLANSQTGNVSQQLNDAFAVGLQEGKNNITSAVSGTFDLAGGGLGALLKGVPWYVWAGVILFFFYPFIARRVAKG